MSQFDLKNAFAAKQVELHGTLLTADVASHPDDKGDISESAWRALLAGLLPSRYQVSQATVVDSRGGKSDAIDVVVHDRHFSPLVFWEGDVKYIPAESVYAVFECKPELNKDYLLYAGSKAASVRDLHRTSAVIVHAGGKILDPKPPPEILSGFLATRAGWSPAFGTPFTEHLIVEGPSRVDLGCVVARGAWEVSAGGTAGTETVDAEKSLVYFALRLLARLQVMGTVPAMDYDAWSHPLRET